MVESTCYGFIFTPHKFRNSTRLLWTHVCRHADNAESECVQDEPGFATVRFITSNAMLVSAKHRNCILCPWVHSRFPLNIVVASPVVHSLLVMLGDVFLCQACCWSALFTRGSKAPAKASSINWTCLASSGDIMPRQSFAFRPGSVLLHHCEADERRTAQVSRRDARSPPGKNGIGVIKNVMKTQKTVHPFRAPKAYVGHHWESVMLRTTDNCLDT